MGDSDSMDVTGDSDDDSDDDDDDSDDTDSDDDSDDTDSSDTNGGSSTVTTQSSVSYCASLSQSQCSNAYADDGTAICAVNAVSSNCYAVVASKGMYGSGNFDDGFNQAQVEMELETQKLNTIVGVLGGLVALLVLVFIAGGCFFYKKTQQHALQMSQTDMEDVHPPHSMEAGDAMPMMTNDDME